jgi:NhaA family Na+:H+ antiporter
MGSPTSARDTIATFMRAEAGGGLALLLGTAVALLWVNVLDAGGYASFWSTHLRIGIGDTAIDESLAHWVNDGLMTLFFFLISLEIKRELVTGDLRHPKAAALPILAAAGGIVVPIAIFLLITGGTDARGWGIPMATDAAFAIGVLALLGDRIGVGVKLFLVTIAVVDDVAAIAVIAIAYSGDIALGWLALALGGLVAVAAMRRLGVTRVLAFVPLGLFVWVATFESGVHATLAGVALALLTPTGEVGGGQVLEEIEHTLHPWVNFAILPLFALANAGVELGGDELSESSGRTVALAVAFGLVAGKFIGIAGAATGALRLRLGQLPPGVDLRGLLGAAALGGIGFTVSLFITPLAYSDPALEGAAKLGILGGSVVAAAIGIAILAPGGRHPSREAD